MGDQTTVTVGVDAHADVHVAAVLDHTGRLLDTRSFPTTTRGYTQLATWAESFGHVDKVGMEGTGSYGSGLLRFLIDYGFTVIEVDRPDRSTRRRAGKSDAQVEMIRALRVARRGAMKARIQAGNQIDALIVSAPQTVRQSLRRLTGRHRIRGCAALRPGPITDPAAATKLALRSASRRWLALQAEIDDLDTELSILVTTAAPDLVALPGVGVEPPGNCSSPPATTLTAALRGRLRPPLRSRPDPGQLRTHRPAPTAPRRRPGCKQRPLARRASPHALPPAHPRLRRPPHHRGQDQDRDHAMPQALHRPRDPYLPHPGHRRPRLAPHLPRSGHAAIRRSNSCQPWVSRPLRSSAARIWLSHSMPSWRPFGNWSPRSQRHVVIIASTRIRHSRSKP
jgi:transposase